MDQESGGVIRVMELPGMIVGKSFSLCDSEFPPANYRLY